MSRQLFHRPQGVRESIKLSWVPGAPKPLLVGHHCFFSYKKLASSWFGHGFFYWALTQTYANVCRNRNNFTQLMQKLVGNAKTLRKLMKLTQVHKNPCRNSAPSTISDRVNAHKVTGAHFQTINVHQRRSVAVRRHLRQVVIRRHGHVVPAKHVVIVTITTLLSHKLRELGYIR